MTVTRIHSPALERGTRATVLALRRLMIFLLSVALLTACKGVARADQSHVGILGGHLVPIGNSTVVLDREDVCVTFATVGRGYTTPTPLVDGDVDASVDVTYVLRNPGATCEATLGLPVFTDRDADNPLNYASTLASFSCRVDGQSVRLRTAHRPRISYPGFHSTTWHVLQVPFSKGEIRTVSTHYAGSVGTRGKFVYLLTPAAAWRVPVRLVHLRVQTAPPLHMSSIHGLNLGAPHHASGAWTWTFHDWLPHANLQVDLLRSHMREPGWWINPSFKQLAR